MICTPSAATVFTNWLCKDCMVPKCTRLFFYSLLIGVGAGKFLGVRRVSAQICPNLPGKSSKEIDLQKKNDCPFFKSMHFKHHFPPNFAQTCPKKGKLKHDHQKKNVCTSILGAIFVKSKQHTAILRKFAHILPKFL